MTDEEIKTKIDDRIERLYSRGLQLTEEGATSGEQQKIEHGRLTFLAGMDIATKSTQHAIRHQISQLKYS